jgi:hypothetical protein
MRSNVLHEGASTQYPFRRVKEGDVLDLGDVSIQVLHTRRHTPEHISLLVTDRTRAPEPWFLLTGHTVMVGDVGRTELASDPEVGSRALFETIERLKQLPDYLEILPGAYAGSVCGRALGGKPVSTIGFERRFNPAFRITDPNEFIQHMLDSIPPAPPDATRIRAAASQSGASLMLRTFGAEACRRGRMPQFAIAACQQFWRKQRRPLQGNSASDRILREPGCHRHNRVCAMLPLLPDHSGD